MSAKLMLVWTEDNRSIGIIEENDEQENYRPLIMFNFKFLGYVHNNLKFHFYKISFLDTFRVKATLTVVIKSLYKLLEGMTLLSQFLKESFKGL